MPAEEEVRVLARFFGSLFFGIASAGAFLGTIHFGYAKGAIGINRHDVYAAGCIVVLAVLYFMIADRPRDHEALQSGE